jgi:uroporphyrinogen decarboxylase
VEPLLVRAARREPVERTPVWFMRQAGRSLPEYRRIRERHSFFEINRSAELTAEVTLQPVRRHGVDAAVVFADIMTPVLGMGVGVDLVEGVGPVIGEPVRSRAAVDALRVPEPEEVAAAVLEAIGSVRSALDAEQAVVGFCGGAFTVAGYLIEGRPSRDFAVTKSLMYREPEVWHRLLEKLAQTFAAYATAQARAGADVVQVFDSWVGALSPADYGEFVVPWSRFVLESLSAAGVPSIHFGTGSAALLPAMAAAGGDVIGLDWRIPLDGGWRLVGDDRAVQGNLDPAIVLGPWPRIEAAALDVLARAGGRPGHIFNLGHGVLPDTDPALLGRLRELVHTETASTELVQKSAEPLQTHDAPGTRA